MTWATLYWLEHGGGTDKGCAQCGGSRRVDGGRPYEVGGLSRRARRAPVGPAPRKRRDGAAALFGEVRRKRRGQTAAPPPHHRPPTPAPRPVGRLPRAAPRGAAMRAAGPPRAPDSVSAMFENVLTRRLGAGFAGLRLGELKPMPGGVIAAVLHPRHCANVGREHAQLTPVPVRRREREGVAAMLLPQTRLRQVPKPVRPAGSPHGSSCRVRPARSAGTPDLTARRV